MIKKAFALSLLLLVTGCSTATGPGQTLWPEGKPDWFPSELQLDDIKRVCTEHADNVAKEGDNEYEVTYRNCMVYLLDELTKQDVNVTVNIPALDEENT